MNNFMPCSKPTPRGRPPRTCAPSSVGSRASAPNTITCGPHEALGDAPPATYYTPSRRALPSTVPAIVYPGHLEVRRVSCVGSISWRQPVFLTESLAGERVGFEEVDDGLWTVYFGTVPLARFDERLGQIRPLATITTGARADKSARAVTGKTHECKTPIKCYLCLRTVLLPMSPDSAGFCLKPRAQSPRAYSRRSVVVTRRNRREEGNDVPWCRPSAVTYRERRRFRQHPVRGHCVDNPARACGGRRRRGHSIDPPAARSAAPSDLRSLFLVARAASRLRLGGSRSPAAIPTSTLRLAS